MRVTEILPKARIWLPMVLTCSLLVACTAPAPNLECDDFPPFVSDNDWTYESTIEERRAMLGEAEDLNYPLPPTLEIIEAHLMLDDLAGAEEAVERHRKSGAAGFSGGRLPPYGSLFGEIDLKSEPRRAPSAGLGEEHILFRTAVARAKVGDLLFAYQVLLTPLMGVLEGELAQTLWRAGYLEDAKTAARRIGPKNRRETVGALIYVSHFEIAAGRQEDARKTLELSQETLSPVPMTRAIWIYLRLARQMLQVGTDQQASEILSQLLAELGRLDGSFWIYWDIRRLLELNDDLGDQATSKLLETALLDGLNQYPFHIREQEQRLIFTWLAEQGYLTKEKLKLLPHKEPYKANRAIAEAAIVDAVTARGDLDVAIVTADSIADEGARCSARVRIVEQLVARGELARAFSLAEQYDSDVCYRPQGLMGTPTTWPDFHDYDPFSAIAVGAAYFADPKMACQALNSTSSKQLWQTTVDEMAAVRAAQGDLDGARELARLLSLQPARQADALVRAAIVYPQPWEP